MTTRVGLITDLHYREVVPGTAKNPKRESRKVGELLRRALEELSRRSVDALVVAGDCVDDETQPGVLEDVAALGDVLLASGLHVILVPGNHDPAPETFYAALPGTLRPPRRQRVGECEVLTYGEDTSTAGTERALRVPAAMAEMAEALRAPGPVTLVVQHYVVFPDHEGPGYNHTYQNASEIRALMEGSPRRVVSLSGHYHRGYPLTVHNGVRYFTGRALCEAPYPYYVIHVEDDAARVEEHVLG